MRWPATDVEPVLIGVQERAAQAGILTADSTGVKHAALDRTIRRGIGR